MKLQIEDLTKSYEEHVALNHVHIVFTNGIYGILGPNGAGKSTLMNLLCLLIKRDSGKILLDDKEITSLGKNYLKQIGYMPQYACLYEDFTLRDYLYYMGCLKGMKKDYIKKQVNELVCSVDLLHQLDVKIKNFSGGMKQRTMLAQALLDNPNILILDEPTAGLDPKQRIAIRNLIAKISKDKIVLIATHVVSDVEFIAKEIMLMDNGNVLQKDTRENLIHTVKGKIVEIRVEENELANIQNKYLVSNLYYKKNELFARILLEANQEHKGELVDPDLEDVYLSYFGKEQAYVEV